MDNAEYDFLLVKAQHEEAMRKILDEEVDKMEKRLLNIINSTQEQQRIIADNLQKQINHLESAVLLLRDKGGCYEGLD